MGKQLHDDVYILVTETDKAICIKRDEDDENPVWLPKSQIEYAKERGSPTQVIVTMPIWVAKDKGLI